MNYGTNLGIYQRDLTGYEDILDSGEPKFRQQCTHLPQMFNQNSPETMMVHVRGSRRDSIICKRKVEKVNTKPEGFKNGGHAAYPSGEYIAHSQ